MIRKVLENIEKFNLIQKGDSIVIGISGGADSLFLTYALNEIRREYNLNLIGVHINHNLRGQEAKRDENFVRDFLGKLNIPVYVYNLDINKIAKENNLSSEEAGRQERYKAFNEVLIKNKFNKIATAHNKDDKAETMLLNLFRGTGLSGLKSISEKRGNIIRPILNISRGEIEEFLNKNNIEYVQDSTNFQTLYTRNKIRLDLLPYIKENINPNIIDTLFNTAVLIGDEEDYLQSLALEEYEKIVEKSGKTIVLSTENVDKVLLKRIIRIGLCELNQSIKDISHRHIDSIIKLKSGQEINLPYNIICKRSFEEIILTYNEEKKFNCFEIQLDREYYLEDEGVFFSISHKKNNFSYYTMSLDCDKIIGQITLRNRKKGDKVFIKNIKGHKKLKDIFIEKKIPSYKRDFVPIIADDEGVICAINVCANDFYKTEKDGLYLQLWRK